MLDDDGDGCLAPDEFTSAIFRLVEGTEFQHRCVERMNTNEIKILLRKITAHVTHQVKGETASVKQELSEQLELVRREMHSNFQHLIRAHERSQKLILAAGSATGPAKSDSLLSP